MKLLKACFLLILLPGIFVGCSSDEDNVDADTANNVTDTGAEEGNETENATTARFIGSWSSACVVSRDDDGDFDAIIYEFEFTDSSFRYSFTTFVDEDCTREVVGLGFSSITRFDGSYNSGDQVTTSSGLIANELTLNVGSGSRQFAGAEIVPTDLSELSQITAQLLVFVDDSDVLFVDDIFLALPDNNTLNLDAPFQRQTDNNTLSIESITELTPLNETIVDLPDRYEITLISASESSLTTKITPHRTQQFRVESVQSCSWTATDRNNNQVIGAGVIEADNNALATVVGVPVVTGMGTRLAIDCVAVHPIVELLEGNWSTGCFLFEGEGNSQSSLLTLSIENNSSVFEGRSYTDLSCNVPAVSPITGEQLVDRVEDTLVFPGETVTTALGVAPFINFIGSSTRFSIFTVTPDNRLFFGAGISNTPENRPLTLDEFFYYERL